MRETENTAYARKREFLLCTDICGSALFSAFPIVRLYSSDATNRKHRLAAITLVLKTENHMSRKAGTTSIMFQRQESRFDDFAVQSLQPFLMHFFGELAFPHHDHFPAHRFKFGMLSDISFVVAQQFRTPEFHIRFRYAGGFRAVFMHMPETAVDEHHRTVFRQHHVGMPRIPLVVFTES